MRARTGQPQRGSHSQSHGVLYSPSSPRVHAPLAAAQKALRAPHTSSNTHKHSRSASHTGEHSGAQQSPEEIARDELQRKLANSARARVGRTSSSGSSESSAATKRLTHERSRELAAPSEPVDSSARSARHVTHQPRKGKVYCGQNKLDPSLRVNGGTLEVGTRSRCFRAGFGGALHQHVDDEAKFVRKFTVPYAPLIAQRLWYKDGPPPEGHQPATLSQARQRGWGAGSAALARKLQKKLHEGSAGAGRTRTRGASARSASPSQ